MTVRKPLIAYGVPVAVMAAAICARLLLEPLLGDRVPFITLFFAVVFAAWYGGWGPALMALIAGAVAAAVLALRNGPNVAANLPEYFVQLVLYCGVGFASIVMFESMRKTRREAVEQSEYLRTTLTSIGEGVITTDAGAGRITSMNAAAEALTGWRFNDAAGQRLDVVFRLLNERTLQQVENVAMQALREGIVVDLGVPAVLLAKDATVRPIGVTVAPIRYEPPTGQIIGSVLVFRDETERRQRQRELESRERQFRTLAETMPQLVWMANPDGGIFWFNRRWYEYTGTNLAQMAGWGWQTVHDPEELPKVLERWQRSIATGEPVEMVFPIRGKDGLMRPFLTRVVPIKDDDGKVVRWFGTNTDISEQQRAEERQRQLLAEAAEANAKFRAFFEQVSLFAGIMDLHGTIIEPNRLSCEGCGYTREQIVGKKFWEGPWWTPSAALVEQIKVGFGQASTGKPFRAEMAYFVAGGIERIADVSILPITDESGAVVFFAPIGTDITERKRVEKELVRLSDQLRQSEQRPGTLPRSS